MLSTESRMRGDMQVRFGGQVRENLLPKGSKAFCTEPTFRERGGIIELAAHLYATDHVPYLLERIAEQTPHVHPVSFSFWQAGLFRSELPTAGDSTAIVSCPAFPFTR